MWISKLIISLICITMKYVSHCSASTNLNHDGAQEMSLHQKRGHDQENFPDKRVKIEILSSHCRSEAITTPPIQEYDQAVTVSLSPANLLNLSGDEHVALNDSTRLTTFEVEKGLFMLIELIPLNTWRQIASYLDHTTKLHQVNRYLFEVITNYPFEKIAQQGLYHHLALRRPSLCSMQGFSLNCDLVTETDLCLIPSYLWFSFIVKVAHLPQVYWSSLKETRVRSLDLNYNNICEDGTKFLAPLSALTELNLANNHLNKQGIDCLTTLKNLTVLNIRSNQLSDDNLIALAAMTHLTDLNIDDNSITTAGLTALSTLTNLIDLNLGNNQIGDIGAAALFRLINLTSLNIENNQISDVGVYHLKPLKNLTELILGHNNIGDRGVLHLAGMTNLISLGIMHNHINDSSARFLTALTQLTFLDMSSNPISTAFQIELRRALRRTAVSFL